VSQRGAGIQRGLDYFERALALDPEYALAHAGISGALALLGFYGYMPAYEGMPKARRAAQRAIDIDPKLAEPYASLMFVMWAYDWDWSGAERAFQRAIALDDRLTPAYLWRALHQSAHGWFEDAIATTKRAIEIDPLSGPSHLAHAVAYISARRFDDAETAAHRGIEIDPNLWPATWARGVALRAAGRLEEAFTLLEQSATMSRRHHWPLSELVVAHAIAGHPQEGQRLREELVERARTQYVPPGSMAVACLGLGLTDEAFEWLERAYREHDTFVTFNHWPYPGTADPRWRQMYRRIGLGSDTRYK